MGIFDLIRASALALALLAGTLPAFGAMRSVTQQVAGCSTTCMVTPLLSQGGSGSNWPSGGSTTNNYLRMTGGSTGSAPGAEQNFRMPIAVTGTISNLRVAFNTTITQGTWTINPVINGVTKTSLGCTVQSGTQTCSDTTGAVNVGPGNYVSWLVTPASAPTVQATPFQVSATFTSIVGNESPLFGGVGVSSNGTGVSYGPFGSSTAALNATEANISSVMPTGGTLDQLYVRTSVNAGASATYTVNIFHGGSATALTCTTAANGNNCSDTDPTHVFTVAQGDTVSYNICPSNAATCPAGSAPAAAFIFVGLRWIPTTAGQSLALGNSSTVPTTASTRWGLLNGASVGSDTTEVDLNVAPIGMTIKNLTVAQSTAPGGVTNRAITLRAGTGSGQANVGTPGNVSCTVVSAGTTCTDNTNSYSAAAGTLLDWTWVPTGTNAAVTWFKTGAVVTVP